ncbi:MAG: alpha-amylase family glycosyl hydrolase [Treponemataceae bacterium]
MRQLPLLLSLFESPQEAAARFTAGACMEFHIAAEARKEYGFDDALFSSRGNVIFANFHAAREFAQRMNTKVNPLIHPERYVKAGKVNAMGLIDEILHHVVLLYREKKAPDAIDKLSTRLETKLGKKKLDSLLRAFVRTFPPAVVHRGEKTVDAYLEGNDDGVSNRILALEELMLLRLANENPAFEPFKRLFDDASLSANTDYDAVCEEIRTYFARMPAFGPDDQSLWELVRSPAIAEPYSLSGQLEYIRKHWGLTIGDYLLRLLTSMDVIKEEEKPVFFGPGPTLAYVYDELEHEYERFSPDKDWMPRVVLMAKSTLVWMHQLSIKYGRPINRLDLIPDEELDELAFRGFTGLWLIGLWERSDASREIKQRCGNPEAAASAYSLHGYDIAEELGGWGALDNFRSRCAQRGVRLGSDMVPNHTGIDSSWVMEHPDRFLQLRNPPFPTYSFNGENLSKQPGVGVYLEDHYWNRSDAAVVFKRVDFNSGDTRYIYHGNDGTSMPWNDTAQIDFLNPEAREAVIATIVGVCKQFPIVRFDAAMTLAKKHIQRLWYPEPGRGGDISSRAEHALSREEFDRRIPNEFWREVVDRCAADAPDTLLLAEAFWMMEGYFVRTLGMHRVYNSAFMNMLKNEENAKYRATIKNTIEFDAEILKRFVNFMNNPDEDTAVAQFGKGDKYFGVCTLMATMPGLPMFGHGQLEGFEEKYGMEYRRAYRDETADADLIARHEREIFPLLKKRRLFSGSEHFALFDVVGHDGSVRENVFAYANRLDNERAFVLYNNTYERAAGWIKTSSPAAAIKSEDGSKQTLCLSLLQAFGLGSGENLFLLFREQRSGLWYIRASRAIDDQGLYVELDGYKSQVFLDLHEVEDSATGRWRRLCEELGGRGVPDLREALQDLFLRDLYAAFLQLATPSYFKGVRALVVPPTRSGAETKGPSTAAPATVKPVIAEKAVAMKKTSVEDGKAEAARFIESLKKPTLNFIRVASEYIDGASGRYESFDTKGTFTQRSAESIWEEFSQALNSILLLGDYAKKTPETLKEDAGIFVKNLTKNFAAEEDSLVYLAGYLVFTLLRGVLGKDVSGEDARRLIDHWCLDRKLREALQVIGINSEITYRIITLLKLILSRTAVPKTKTKAGESETNETYDLVKDAFIAEDSRSFLGVNVFEGVVWYKKERFEEALFYASAVAAVESDGTAFNVTRRNKRLEAIAQTVSTLKTANEAAGFRMEALLEKLETPLDPGRGVKRSLS